MNKHIVSTSQHKKRMTLTCRALIEGFGSPDILTDIVRIALLALGLPRSILILSGGTLRTRYRACFVGVRPGFAFDTIVTAVVSVS